MMMKTPKNQHATAETALHCGKWTPEEEAYVQCLIEEFQSGYLPIREGTSLRSFLSKMLNCKPKRISKKFEGSDYNGKQVYVSQPYKLNAEEARERRDRLCTLEKKFHDSVAELKNNEGVKQQAPCVDEPLDALVPPAGRDSLPMASAASASASFPVAASMPSGRNVNMNMNRNSIASMSGIHNVGDLTGQQQIFDELAFQESVLRLRAHQHHQQQQQQEAHFQSAAVAQQQEQQQAQSLGGAGSYVDPILGSLALSQNAVNTTPLSASHQYWRRQALLEASSHLDSIRMAQVGAIGIQRPSLEPGGLRDLRMPLAAGNGGMPVGYGDFDGLMDAGTAAALKKRHVAGMDAGKGGDGSNSNKRLRRNNELPDVAMFGRFPNF